jgi:polysaccharide biosynthesis protein PslA
MNIQTARKEAADFFQRHVERTSGFTSADLVVPAMLNAGGDIIELRPSPLLLQRSTVERSRQATAFAIKRAADIVGSALAILILSPLLIATALVIKLTSRGPVFFAQRRWGKGNVPFRMYKFRSMYVDLQDVSGIAQTVHNDPRVTPVGRFIRRFSIDELPQLFNILKGDMSIVGPRAHVPGMHAAGIRYEDLVPHYFARHAVRPGLTGLAQVRGLRGEVADEAHAFGRVAADLEYIRSFSLWSDLKIMFWTIPAVLTGRAAF